MPKPKRNTNTRRRRLARARAVGKLNAEKKRRELADSGTLAGIVVMTPEELEKNYNDRKEIRTKGWFEWFKSFVV